MILSPCAMPTRVSQIRVLSTSAITLEVEDDESNYSCYDGYGLFVYHYIKFLVHVTRHTTNDPAFNLGDYSVLDSTVFDCIREHNFNLGNILTDFTNQFYEDWRRNELVTPDHEDVRGDCRDYCDSCDYGWSDYDPDDEDDQREFICEDDCDNFADYVRDTAHNNIDFADSYLFATLYEEYGIRVPTFKPRDIKLLPRLKIFTPCIKTNRGCSEVKLGLGFALRSKVCVKDTFFPELPAYARRFLGYKCEVISRSVDSSSSKVRYLLGGFIFTWPVGALGNPDDPFKNVFKKGCGVILDCPSSGCHICDELAYEDFKPFVGLESVITSIRGNSYTAELTGELLWPLDHAKDAGLPIKIMPNYKVGDHVILAKHNPIYVGVHNNTNACSIGWTANMHQYVGRVAQIRSIMDPQSYVIGNALVRIDDQELMWRMRNLHPVDNPWRADG